MTTPEDRDQPSHMQIVAEGKPANPNLAFERWERATESWVACSFRLMQPWDIWRFAMCRYSTELCDLVPSQKMLDRAETWKPPNPSMAISEVQASYVMRDQLIFVDHQWWRVLGNHWVEADCGPAVYIWREGNCGIEDITVLERFEPHDLCIVKKGRVAGK